MTARPPRRGPFGRRDRTGAATARPAATGLPSAVGDKGGLYPRWPFLAATLLSPLSIAGYVLYLAFRTGPCPFGAFCRLDTLPGVAQVTLMWLAFGLAWLAAFVFGVGPLEITAGPEGPSEDRTLTRFCWRISNHSAVRPLLILYGAFALSGIIFSVERGRVLAPALGLGGILATVAFCAVAWRQDEVAARRAHSMYVEGMERPLYIFRTLPIVDHIWPPRAQQSTAPPAP